jgi:hypothetical protein
MSRMSVSSTTELGYLVDKIMMYEQYTMPDPSYLNNVLLIAGADGYWAPRVGRPTINYAADNYFNAAHGFNNVYKYVTDNYSGCYNYLSSGVGFANYTAHGDIQEWSSPNFTNTNVNALTNANKYFWEICTQIANAVGITKEEVYRDCIKHCGVSEDCEMTKEAGEGMSKMWSAIGTGWFTEQVDYAEDGDSLLIRRFYGSSTYDTKQMSRIIDYAVNEAKNIGIETDTPEEINRIKSLWKGSGINA